MNAQTQQSNGDNSIVQGRIVWVNGKSLFEGKHKTDYNTNQLEYGPDGQPIIEYGFGLAIPKINPATGQNSEEYVKIWQALYNEAMTLYPSGQIPPDFAMKFKDGDAVDHNGKPFADREGYAGHIVLTCTTRIPIKYFIHEGGNNVLVNSGIKNGDYVNVQLNIKAHPAKGRGKAGLYLNPSAVQLIQAGKEIINTPSGDQIFGQVAPNYSGQVVADQAPAMPNNAPVNNVAMPNNAPVNNVAMPNNAPVNNVAMPVDPHYGVLPQGMQPIPQGNATAQPVAATPTHGIVPPVTPTPAMGNGSVPTAYPSNNAQSAPIMPQMP